MEHVLESRLSNEIVLITLSRPEAANALSVRLLEELYQVLINCRSDQSVRCLIITGVGTKYFCAGADLKERLGMDIEQVRSTLSLIRKTINAIASFPCPIVAAINGVALGGGTELAIACDIRIASNKAVFGLTETAVGIIPGAGGTQRLPRLVGIGRAKDLIYTARKVSADEALEIGLIEHIASPEALLGQAVRIAEQIAKNAPIAVRQAKRAIENGFDSDIAEGLIIEEQAYEITIASSDRLEGLQAFKEKRNPLFTGKYFVILTALSIERNS